MFEVTEEMLAELSGDATHGFELRGPPDSDAVLVTSTKTSAAIDAP
jgi:hypothetical protein